MYRKLLNGLLLISTLLLSYLSWGAPSLPSVIDNQDIQEVRDRIEDISNEERRQQRAAQENSRVEYDIKPGHIQNTSSVVEVPHINAQACIAVKQTLLYGHEFIKEQPIAYQKLNNNDCVSVADIDALLNELNIYYQQLGYITTRVYAPEQDLSLGTLVLQLVAGRLEKFEYADENTAYTRLLSAFAVKLGDIINLRDLEQGLENLNALNSQKAQIKIFPGTKVGYSIIKVQMQNTKAWQGSFDFNNSGFKTTGQYKAGFNGAFENVSDRNDRFALSLNSTPFEERGDKYSDAINVSYAIPMGHWSTSLGAGYSRYRFNIKGIHQDYKYNGHSRFLNVSVKRLITRNQNDKYYVLSDLKLLRSSSYIEDFEVESQARKLSVASVQVQAKNYIGNAELDWRLGAKFGLDIFGAENSSGLNVERSLRPDPYFEAVIGQAQLRKSLNEGGLLYTGLIAGQLANKTLPSSEQFSAGGRYDVRGYHSDNLYGDTGLYVRNEMAQPLVTTGSLKVSGFIGIDAGYIKFPKTHSWSQHHVTGAVIGARTTLSGRSFLELAYARSLDRPQEFDDNKEQLYLDVSASF